MYKRILAGVGAVAFIAVFPGVASSQDVFQNNAQNSFNDVSFDIALSSSTLSQVMSGPLTINLPTNATGSTFSTGDITGVTVGPNTGNTVVNMNTGLANQGAAISVSTIVNLPEGATGGNPIITSLGLGTPGATTQ